MKYKLIKAMAHNWTHSFVSWNNYVDDGYVIEDLRRLARERKGEEVVVTWIPVRWEEAFRHTLRIRTSVSHYRKDLPAHLARHRVAIEAIAEMRTEVFLAKNFRMYVRSYVLDDRGKEHTQYVWSQ